MRRDRLWINNVQRLSQLKEDLRQILRDARTLGGAALERAADQMYEEALMEVPIKTGALQQSIEVNVSYSPRYPGIIATATATNPRTGYDYARIQEENEAYQHEIGKAHYLSDPFERAVTRFLEEISR